MLGNSLAFFADLYKSGPTSKVENTYSSNQLQAPSRSAHYTESTKKFAGVIQQDQQIETSFEKSMRRQMPHFDKAEVANAEQAKRDALTVISGLIQRPDRAFINDAAIAVLQWNVGRSTVLMLFSGDGVATLSSNKNETFHIANSSEFRIHTERDNLLRKLNDLLS